MFQLRKDWSTLTFVVGGAWAMIIPDYAVAGDAPVSPFAITASDVADPVQASRPFRITERDVHAAAAVAGRTLTYEGTESAGTEAITNNQGDNVHFVQQSTAANATIVNNSGGSAQFSDESSAGSAFITNNAGSSVSFSGESTADGANVTNNQGGTVSFADQSKGGSSAIANNGAVSFSGDSDAQQLNLTNNGGATVTFSDQSHAGTAQLTNNGTIGFQGDASAEGSLIINNGSGILQFVGSSTADTSAVTNNGKVAFDENATAGSASLINNATGIVTFSGMSSAGSAFIANSGQVEFENQSSSGSAEIVNNATGTLLVSGGATLADAKVNNGGRIVFSGHGSAGAAKIITGPDGATIFTQSSDGGTAALQTDHGGVVDFSGVTVGASVGSLAGPGTYYLGGVVVTVGGNGLSTTVDGAIVDGGLSGGTGGSLVKVGNGTLTLSGANSYTGATVVQAGVLQAGAAGSLAHGSDFEVDAGALLDLAGFDQRVGSLAGSGTVDLATGTLTLGRDGHDSSFDGQISGTGGLVKAGDGLFELAGTNSYSGATSVVNGELRVSGSIAESAVEVGRGSVLSGTGTVGQTSVAGTLARRNDGGTLTVNGDLTFTAGGTYAVAVSATPTVELVSVLGTAKLGGSLVVSPVGKFSLDETTIRIVSASDVEGTFASVNSAMPFIDMSVIYGLDSVDLDVSRNGRDFAATAQTPNQAAVARALDGLGSGSIYVAVVNSPSAAAARTAFDALSGEIYASIPVAAIEADLRLRGMLIERAAERLRMASTEPAFWIRPYFADFSYVSDGNAATLDGSASGTLVGADAALGDNSYVGLAAGYGRSHLDLPDRSSSAAINTLSLAGYVATQYSGWRATAGGLASWHDIDTDRIVSFTGFDDRTRASYRATSDQIYGELGYPIAVGAAEWTPFMNIAYAWWRRNGFREDGGDAALSIPAGSDDGIIGTAGLRMASEFPLGDTARMQLGGVLGWRIASLRPDGGWASLDGSAPFFIGGVPMERNAGLLALNAGIVFGRISMGIAYEGTFGGGTRSQNLRGMMNMRF